MSTEDILFSIITPCYNLENIVSDTINSVIQQTYNNFELILINDGSSDNTLKELHFFSSKDTRIKVYSKENGGVSAARNYGISKAQGDYLLFLDGDDRIDSHLLESAHEVLKKREFDMYSFGYVKVDSSGRKIKSYSKIKFDSNSFSGEEFLEKYLYKKMNQHICSYIIKRDIIVSNSIIFNPKTKYAEDVEFIIKSISKCSSVYYDSKEYFLYYHREGSAVNRRIILDNFEVYTRIESYLKDVNNIAGRQFLCFWYVNFYKTIIKKGSNPDTVKQYLKFEYLLKYFRFKFDKYSIVTFIFIVLYRMMLRSHLIKQYELEKSA